MLRNFIFIYILKFCFHVSFSSFIADTHAGPDNGREDPVAAAGANGVGTSDGEGEGEGGGGGEGWCEVAGKADDGQVKAAVGTPADHLAWEGIGTQDPGLEKAAGVGVACQGDRHDHMEACCEELGGGGPRSWGLAGQVEVHSYAGLSLLPRPEEEALFHLA